MGTRTGERRLRLPPASALLRVNSQAQAQTYEQKQKHKNADGKAKTQPSACRICLSHLDTPRA